MEEWEEWRNGRNGWSGCCPVPPCRRSCSIARQAAKCSLGIVTPQRLRPSLHSARYDLAWVRKDVGCPRNPSTAAACRFAAPQVSTISSTCPRWAPSGYFFPTTSPIACSQSEALRERLCSSLELERDEGREDGLVSVDPAQASIDPGSCPVYCAATSGCTLSGKLACDVIVSLSRI